MNQETLEQEFFRWLMFDTGNGKAEFAGEVLDQVSASTFDTIDGRDAYHVARYLFDKGEPLSTYQLCKAQYDLKRSDAAIARLSDWLLGVPVEWYSQYAAGSIMALVTALKHRQAVRERGRIYGRAAEASTAGDFSEADRLAQEASAYKLEGVTANNIGGKELVESAVSNMIRGSNAIPTYFYDLDASLYGGFGAGELAIIGARPGAGKSSFALGLQERWADKGICSLYVSCEDPHTIVGTRLASLISKHNMFLPDAPGMGALQTAMMEADKLQDHIRFFPAIGLGIDDVCEGIRRACSKGSEHKSPRIVLVDYLQAIRSKGSHPDQRRHELRQFAQALKTLGNKLGIPVILYSQLSRIDGEPTMQNLRDSGELEEMAEYVVLLWRTETESWMRLAKAKRGIAGKKFEVLWNPQSRMIDDVRLAASQAVASQERRSGTDRRGARVFGG